MNWDNVDQEIALHRKKEGERVALHIGMAVRRAIRENAGKVEKQVVMRNGNRVIRAVASSGTEVTDGAH